MIACYDLAHCPPTFDAVAFLMLAEAERLKRAEKNLQLHILPGPEGGFRQDGIWPFGIDNRLAMLRNVVVPMCEMLPSVISLTVDADRPAELMQEYGANTYLISLPNILDGLRHGCRPLRANRPRVVDSVLVTITLRESDHWPRRNSRLQEWREAALGLQERGYEVVFVRDTQRAADPLPPFKTAPEASTDLHERARLYSRACLNLGISNGPIWFALAMDVPVLMMRPTTEQAGGPFDRQFFSDYGLRPGTQLPTSPSYQQLVWEDDTADQILKAFDLACPT